MSIWTEIRNVCYALMSVSSLVWAVAYLLRWRRTRSIMSWWAGAAGLAMFLFATSGWVSVVVAHVRGFGGTTAVIFTAGVCIMAGTMLAGAVHLFWLALRNGSKARTSGANEP